MLRWLALVALLAAGCVSAADAQQRESSKDFNHLVGNINCSPQNSNCDASGIWSNGTIMWVADSFQNPKIYAYSMSSKSPVGSEDFELVNANASPHGIWSNGTFMWVADLDDNAIYAYNMSSKSRITSVEIVASTLSNAGNIFPGGIWSNGTIMWVADTNTDKIYTYNMTSKSRVTSLEFDLVAGRPTGIWSDGTTMWVADDTPNGEWVYAYTISSKLRDPMREFNITASDSPYGIWSDGTTMWVADYGGSEKIYAYKLPAPAPAPTVSSPRVFVYIPPPDTTPPRIVSVERTGNATTTNHTLTWDVRFSESVRVGLADVHTTYASVANATIPDLGMVHDTLLADVPGAVTGGSVSVDLNHPITSGLLIELVAPDCTKFVIHNQTTTFLYKLRQPYDLGDLSGVGAAGQWTLHVSDRAKYWNGTLNGWTLELESRGVVEGSGRTHTITQYVAGPGNYTLSLDGFNIRDRAGNYLRDSDPAVNEPYLVVGAAVRTCQTE